VERLWTAVRLPGRGKRAAVRASACVVLMRIFGKTHLFWFLLMLMRMTSFLLLLMTDE